MYFILKGPCTKTHTKHYVTQLVENVGVEVIYELFLWSKAKTVCVTKKCTTRGEFICIFSIMWVTLIIVVAVS